MADLPTLPGSQPPGGGLPTALGGGAPPAMPGGGPGPSIAPARPNIGATSPQGNPGNAAKAMSDVRNAVQLLESALPAIPMGTPLHSEILNATKNLLKHMEQGDGNQGLDMMSLLSHMRGMAQGAPMNALAKMFPQGGPPAMGAGGPMGAS